MKILFVHQNFPGQFRHLVSRGAALGWQMVAICSHSAPGLPGVRLLRYPELINGAKGVHPWALDLQVKMLRAEAVARKALHLKASGWRPDVIYGHPGWGECYLLADIFPDCPQLHYLEYYFHASGGDVGFDPEFPAESPWTAAKIKSRNLILRQSLEDMTWGITPTQWQASRLPLPAQDRVSVIFDGVDTDLVVPDQGASLALSDHRMLSRHDEVITFVSRNLEPYRGFHVFMRALPLILQRRPRAQVVIVGGDQISYGSPPGNGRCWRECLLKEVGDSVDLSRVHFVGRVPYPAFVKILQVSRVHVYLTYPFVLSWSLVEAMSAGCAIVASDTAPVLEFLTEGETGLLFPFFDTDALAARVFALLDDPVFAHSLGQAARNEVQLKYDLMRVCLPEVCAEIVSCARLG